MPTRLETVRDFLAQKRIAVVGVSREPKDFTRMLYREFRDRGYDTVPVHNQAQEIEGTPCFASVADVAPPVDAVLVLTSAGQADAVVRNCDQAGVRRVWLYRAVGAGAADPQAIAYCHEHGMAVVEGECPMMFFESTPWFHAMHGWIKKITGSYPR